MAREDQCVSFGAQARVFTPFFHLPLKKPQLEMKILKKACEIQESVSAAAELPAFISTISSRVPIGGVSRRWCCHLLKQIKLVF